MTGTPKVLQFCHSYGMPFADVARQYAALFDASPYEVVTVFLTGPEDKEVADLVGGKVIFLKNTSKEVRGMKRKQIKQLKAICEQYVFEFAIAHRFKPLYIASFIKNLPVIGVHHAYGDYIRWNRRRHAYKHKNRIRLLGVSDAIRDDMRKSLPEFPVENIQTLYNRVDVDAISAQQLSKKAAREALNLPEQAFIFGNVGRLHPDKDQSTLLKAFAKVHETLIDSLLVIIGEGRLEQALKQEATMHGVKDNVYFLGKVPDAVKYYKAFNCFVLSSDHEPFGMVLLEAMVAGVPAIASDCGGAPEVVGNTGQLFSSRDSSRLVDCMQAAYNVPAENAGMNEMCMRKRVREHFSDKAVHEAFWALPFIKDITGKYGHSKALA